MLDSRSQPSIQTVTSEAALKALDPGSPGDVVRVIVNYSGNRSVFVWDAHELAVSDTLGVIKPDSLTVGQAGRWVFQNFESIKGWEQPSDFPNLRSWFEADDYCSTAKVWTARAGTQATGIVMNTVTNSRPYPNGAKQSRGSYINDGGANASPVWNCAGGMSQVYVGSFPNGGSVAVQFGSSQTTFLWSVFANSGLFIAAASGVTVQWYTNAELAALSGIGFACAVSWEFATKRIRGVLTVAGSNNWDRTIDTTVASMNSAPSGIDVLASVGAGNMGRGAFFGSAFDTKTLKRLARASALEFGL